MRPLPLARIEKLLNVVRPTTPAGEQVAAVLAIGRILEAHEADWSDVLRPALPPLQKSPPRPRYEPPSTPHLRPWRDAARQCLQRLHVIDAAEEDFLANIIGRDKPLSDKQLRWLRRIERRVLGEQR